MDRKEDLADIGARFRELIVRDPRAGDEIRLGRAVFLEEVERRNAASSVRRRPTRRHRRRWLPLRLVRVRRGRRGGPLALDASGDLSDR